MQAALNAARTLLPSGMPSNPTYRKMNPADAPAMTSLTSETMSRAEMYDAASTILAQKISQIDGIGRGGRRSITAVRVELDPPKLTSLSISPDEVRARPSSPPTPTGLKGAIEDETRHWQILANDQAKKAADYVPRIVVAAQRCAG